MIKVSVIYPNAPDAKFDHAYFCDTHMPMVADRLGAACKHYSIDKGLADAPYIAMVHVISESADAFNTAFGPHAAEITGDIPHYTDLAPIFQFSEVVVE